MSEIKALLESIAGSGEICTIVYNGGSTPGQPRQIVVAKLNDETVVAIELGQRTSKTFKLNKIERVELSLQSAGNSDAPPAPPSPVHLPKLATMKEYAVLLTPQLSSAGWQVEETAIRIGISVARFYKNGKPKTVHVASISYSDPYASNVYDPTTDNFPRKTDLTGRERPWGISTPGPNTGKTFSKIESAFDAFWADVSKAKPSDW